MTGQIAAYGSEELLPILHISSRFLTAAWMLYTTHLHLL